jgi:sulfoxide reductase heme-binding subunit YedZ
MKDPTFWMLARASGLLAYAALTASTLLGLRVKARPFRSLSRATVTDLHRFVAFTALAALAIHAIALVLDSAMPMPVPALVIPGLSPYRPIWISAGVVTAELMILLIVSFTLRRFLGTNGWRRLHWATYATYALAAIHGVASGTDTSRPWATAFYAITVGSVAAAAVWRALVPPPRRVPAAPPARRIPNPTIKGARP